MNRYFKVILVLLVASVGFLLVGVIWSISWASAVSGVISAFVGLLCLIGVFKNRGEWIKERRGLEDGRSIMNRDLWRFLSPKERVNVLGRCGVIGSIGYQDDIVDAFGQIPGEKWDVVFDFLGWVVEYKRVAVLISLTEWQVHVMFTGKHREDVIKTCAAIGWQHYYNLLEHGFLAPQLVPKLDY